MLRACLPLLVALPATALTLQLPDSYPNKDGLEKYMSTAMNSCQLSELELYGSGHHKNILMLGVFAENAVQTDRYSDEFTNDFNDFFIKNIDCDNPSSTGYESILDGELHRKHPKTMNDIYLLAPRLICERIELGNIIGESYACR